MVVVSLTAFSEMGSFLLELSVPIYCYETLSLLTLYMFGMVIELFLNLMQHITFQLNFLKKKKSIDSHY